MDPTTIPHAKGEWVEIRPPDKIVHVVALIPGNPASANFDAGAKLELEKAGAARQYVIDAGCTAVFHYPDAPDANR